MADKEKDEEIKSDAPKKAKSKKVKIPSAPKEEVDPAIKRQEAMVLKTEKKIHHLITLRSFMTFVIIMVVLAMITVIVYSVFQKISFLDL